MKDRQYKWGHRINWTDIERSNRLEKDNGGHSFVPIAAKWMAGVRNWWSWYRAEIQQINCRPIGPKSISWPKNWKILFWEFFIGLYGFVKFQQNQRWCKILFKIVLMWPEIPYEVLCPESASSYRIWTVFSDEFIYNDIVLLQFWSSVVPANYLFTSYKFKNLHELFKYLHKMYWISRRKANHCIIIIT